MKTVINCAHRGAMAVEPENTLRAFARAAEMGAQQVELDVILSGDGVPVVSHDAKPHGVEPAGGDLRKMTLPEIKKLRFRGEELPTLQEAVDLCREKGMLLNIEIKDPNALEKTVELINCNSFYERCQVSCFRYGIIKRAKSLDARVKTAYLAVPVVKWVQLKLAAAAGCESINPACSCVTARFVEAAHGLGLTVFAWPVNSPDAMRRLIGYGVDGIMTDTPDVLTRVKKELGVG